MKAISFTEHGNIYQWVKKKQMCDKFGIKYIHGVEVYITSTLNEKIRDNYHTCLYARNWNGVKEINKLVSLANNREDNHFYYVPRISIDEFCGLSENILVSTACLGGVLASDNEEVKAKYIDYLIANKNRCFLELQHHQVRDQILHNQYLYKLSVEKALNLIIGSDTHALNKEHLEGRKILQKSKGIYFENEEGWDLSLKTYDELLEEYKKQNSLDIEVIKNALENTNKLADMVESFNLDYSHRYPRLYEDSNKVFKEKIIAGVKKRGLDKKENYKEYQKRINYENKVFKHNNAIDFMLLEEDVMSWCNKNDIYTGYSRGSCSGSIIAYALGITEMDSIKHKLNFERFMNTERVSLADIDTDYPPSQRELVKEYLFNKQGLYCADIITFNTVALKGSIRDVCKALYKEEIPKELNEQAQMDVEGYGTLSDSTSKAIRQINENSYLNTSNYICENVETDEARMRKEYPEVFRYVDLLNGVIVSVGNHPCGTVVSPIPLDESMGLFTTSTNKYPITQINMKEIDGLNFVKLDLLGLDNIEVINETCKLVGIERLTPDNVDDKDEKVWEDISKNTLGIFQWESESAFAYLNKLFSKETICKIKESNKNFSYIDLFSMGNGAIRPAGESYRQALAEGDFKDNGHPALNEFLLSTMGYLVYQEQIIEFLNKFCGFTMGEADTVRRGFAKKTGTEQYIPRIKEGFKQAMLDKYNISSEESERLIIDFIKVIEAASDYLFSLNHSQSYSYIGYICGYLRYYYPLQFLTVLLNINQNNMEKTSAIIEYAKTRNVVINTPKFRYSKGEYFFDKDTNSIYQGIGSLKGLNQDIGNKFYEMRGMNFNSFVDLLQHIKENRVCNTAQVQALIKIGFFKEYGSINYLLGLFDLFEKWYDKKMISKSKFDNFEYFTQFGDATEKTVKNIRWKDIIADQSKNINSKTTIKDVLMYEHQILGYCSSKFPSIDENIEILIDLDEKYTPKATFYNISSGSINVYKIYKKTLVTNPLKLYDITEISSLKSKNKTKRVNDQWVETDEKELVLIGYKVRA